MQPEPLANSAWVNRVGLTAYRRLPLCHRQRNIVRSARQVRFVPCTDLLGGSE